VTQQPHVRMKQATLDLSELPRMGIEALSILTKANCSSTPALLDWQCEGQDAHMWVPGGYNVYILMEKLPAVDPSRFYWRLDRKNAMI
jgi:hypothetical protein